METIKGSSAKVKKSVLTRHQVGKTKKSVITPEQRYQMISDAAYYRALHEGFYGNNILGNWLDAELEIDRKLQP